MGCTPGPSWAGSPPLWPAQIVGAVPLTPLAELHPPYLSWVTVPELGGHSLDPTIMISARMTEPLGPGTQESSSKAPPSPAGLSWGRLLSRGTGPGWLPALSPGWGLGPAPRCQRRWPVWWQWVTGALGAPPSRGTAKSPRQRAVVHRDKADRKPRVWKGTWAWGQNAQGTGPRPDFGLQGFGRLQPLT